jgi:hypothetical protein
MSVTPCAICAHQGKLTDAELIFNHKTENNKVGFCKRHTAPLNSVSFQFGADFLDEKWMAAWIKAGFPNSIEFTSRYLKGSMSMGLFEILTADIRSKSVKELEKLIQQCNKQLAAPPEPLTNRPPHVTTDGHGTKEDQEDLKMFRDLLKAELKKREPDSK